MELIKTKMLQTIMQLTLFNMMIVIIKIPNNKKLIKFSFKIFKTKVLHLLLHYLSSTILGNCH